MTTIVFVFLFTFLLALLATPIARRVGFRLKAVDMPDSRKVHKEPIARSGGLAIFSCFMVMVLLTPLFNTAVSSHVVFDKNLIGLLGGGCLIFLMGFLDDIMGLNAWLKLMFHILAASLAYFSGLNIQTFALFGYSLNILANPVVSYLITVFWFVLFINAVNLIDGLDGLAGGLCLFASGMMVILMVIMNNFELAYLFAILAGSTAGFLRYNFNPASIFLGDGGSYFLGYIIAGLAIMGSVKSQVGAIMLIPLVAMGVPLFDTLISPIRRFILGRKIFQPDKGHFHHKLIEKGISTHRVVLILYGITFFLCLASILIVNLRNEQAGLVLVFLGVGAFFLLKILGYFKDVSYEKMQGWLRDISDATGIRKDRRTFLNHQVKVHNSKTLEELWENITSALDSMEIDYAEISIPARLVKSHSPTANNLIYEFHPQVFSQDGLAKEDRYRKSWRRNGFDPHRELANSNLFKLELPLTDEPATHESFGLFWIVKDLTKSPFNHYSLTRIEHLRRSIIRCLKSLID